MQNQNQVKLSNDEVSSVCRSLELMVHSGVSLPDAARLLADDESDKDLKERFNLMADELAQGESFAKAAQDAGCFPEHVCALINVGESTGNSEKALRSLANHYERLETVNKHIRSALLYPAVLIVIMLAVVIILLAYVLPVFNDAYAKLGSSLKGVAAGLLGAGNALRAIMPVLCVVLGIAVILLIVFSLSPAFREKILASYRRKHGDKGVSGKLNTARFAEACAMGLSSGLSTDEAVELAATLMEDIPSAKERSLSCGEALRNGSSLAKALSDTGLIPKSSCRLLEIAERSGVTDSAMEKIADSLQSDAEEALEAKLARVEPALVLICTALVGLILLSVMLPLMNIMSVLG